MNFAAIQSLDAEMRSIDANERRGLVRFLRCLDVFDREHAYAALNCGSAFDYLVREHHLPEGTAWRRVTAMKLIRRFPVLETALEDGRLNTTQLGMLSPILTAENVDDLVRRATHLTTAKTKELAVSIRPKEVPANGLRKLPTPALRPAAVPEAPAPDAPGGPSSMMGIPESTTQATLVPPPPLVPRPLRRSSIEPVAEDFWQWRIGMNGETKAKLDTLRGYLRHKIPDGDLDNIDPAAMTGSSTAKDLTTKCIPHNHYRAILRYGLEHVLRRIEEGRRAREARRLAKAGKGQTTLCEPVALWG